MNENTVKMTP